MSLAFCYIVLTKSMNKQNRTKLKSLFHSQNGLALLSASFIAGLSIGLENTSVAIHQVTKKRSVLAVKEICLKIYILSNKPWPLQTFSRCFKFQQKLVGYLEFLSVDLARAGRLLIVNC